MNNFFIILAAGKSKRFNSNIPKPYYLYRGLPLIQHSIEKIKDYQKISKIIVVVNRNHKRLIEKLKIKNVKILIGGKTRAESAYLALKNIKKYKVKNVLIHDAARPNFSIKLVDKIIKYLKHNKCVVPAIKTNNSVKLRNKKKIFNINRKDIYLTQTPQGFNYNDLLKLQKNKKFNITDDSSLFIEAQKKIVFINGEINNYKITTKKDIKNNFIIKYGIGFDVHRLVYGKKLFLGGVLIKSKLGTLGHSDGDPVLHSITDAILGACKKGDIGEKFSDKNKKFKNIRSTILLKKVINEIELNNFKINNIDVNIITQTPKIQKHKNRMINCISEICNISKTQINIKGKTTEKLGLIGKEKAIACEVIASVIKYE